LQPCMPKTAAAAFGLIKTVNNMQAGPADRSQHQLGDAVAPADSERLLTKIDQAYFDFAPIISINRAWRIDHCDTVLDRQTGAGPDLQFKTLRHGNGETARKKMDVARLKDDILSDSGGDIHARRQRGGVCRQRQVPLLRRKEPAEPHRNIGHHMPRPNFLTIVA